MIRKISWIFFIYVSLLKIYGVEGADISARVDAYRCSLSIAQRHEIERIRSNETYGTTKAAFILQYGTNETLDDAKRAELRSKLQSGTDEMNRIFHMIGEEKQEWMCLSAEEKFNTYKKFYVKQTENTVIGMYYRILPHP